MKTIGPLKVLLAVLFAISTLLGACAPAPTVSPTATPVSSDTPPPEETALPTETPVPPTETSVPPTDTSAPPAPEPTSTPSPSTDLVFASFDKPAVRAEPVIHHEEIAPDLSNVENPFLLSQAQLDRLSRDGVVVSPGTEKEFFTLYEQARYTNVPIFVTTDSLLHVYHLLFDKVLRTAEVEHFIPMLRDLNAALLARTDEIYRALQDTDWEDPARRTVAFVGVASQVLDPDVLVPAYAEDLVEAEVALVEDAAGMLPSPIFPELRYGEDYTQYIPRGHYTKSDALKAYFKSMMWYGRMTFRVSRPNETRSALLLVHALRTAQVKGRPALEPWADLYSSTVFFVGRSDDLTVLQYGKVMDQIYGDGITVDELVDEQRLERFIEDVKLLPPPRILGIVIMDTENVEEETKGMRFMGQRFVPDAYIFRELMYRNVGTRDERRGLPKGLDIPAAMGSERAYQLLDEMGETRYANYDAQMDKMQSWLSGLSVEEWTETLYNSWLYCFHPLLDVPGDGYPAFMRSEAWVDKQLNTVLGSFAELKHDTILYAKQAYAELGGAPPPPPPAPPRGYVEPLPEFYARLTALTEMTLTGLGQRGLLVEQDEASLQRLSRLAQSLQTMAEKELRGEPLTEDEYRTIRFYGGELEHLTMAAADTPDEGYAIGGQAMPEEQPQAAVIADVATDPWPQLVLELGVGRIDELHAVVPLIEDDGSITLQVAKGGVFSYYEFTWPMDDRLTDEKWREMLAEGEAPPRPDWISSFYTQEGEHSALRRTISSFLKSQVNAFWYLEPGNLYAGEALQDQLASEVEALQSENRYQGRTLVGLDFRSFDRQSEDLAVVAARETWQDALYQFEGDWPGYAEEPIAQRGPYTLEVTYTLEWGERDRWQVTRAVYADEPPSWQ
jgi:hypothetical protein